MLIVIDARDYTLQSPPSVICIHNRFAMFKTAVKVIYIN